MDGAVEPVRLRLRQVLDRAADLDEPERSSFLEAACAADRELREALQTDPLALPCLEDLDWPEADRQHFAGNARFEIRRCLGAGGFGEVFEAFDRASNSTVALKVLRRVESHAVEGFKRGFRALQRLTHNNVCHVYEILFDAGSRSWLLTMEMIRGEPLLSYLSAHPGRVKPVFLQVARGLQALHRAEILHCDIKPSNVVVTDEGRPVLVDFGLARPVQSIRDKVPALTPAYAAPELLNGEAHTAASDWYALGRMLGPAIGGSRRNSELLHLAARLTAADPAERPDGEQVLRVLSGTGGSAPPPRSSFVGREAEIRSVCEWFETAVAGTGVTLHITGPSGIGKTALVQEAIRVIRAAHPDAIVLRGTCYQGESLPYKALDETAAQMAAAIDKLPFREAMTVLSGDLPLLARLFPVFGATAHPPAETGDGDGAHRARDHSFEAFWRVAGNLSRLAPLLIVIDDLQWSDLDSSRLLSEFTGRLRTDRILLITIRRQEAEPPPGFESLARGAGEIAIGPLTGSQSEQLVRLLLDSPPAGAVAAVVAEGAGSPFLLRQLALHVRSGGAASSLTLVMEAILSELTREQRDILEVLSVAKSPLAMTVLQRAARTGESFAHSRARLINGCLIRGDGSSGEECAAPYHDRIGEIIAASLPPPREREIHEALARALDESGDSGLESVAIHYYRAGFPDLACQRAVRAAERASAVLAFDRAARLYQHVLDWSDGQGYDVGALEKARGDALVNCGRGIEGARAYARALPGTPETARMPLRIRIASVLVRSGEIAEGMAMLRHLLREHDLPVPSTKNRMIARLLWERMRIEIRRRLPLGHSGEGGRGSARLDACWAAAVGTAMVHPLFKEICCLIYLRLALESGNPARLAVGWSGFATNLAHVDDGELRQAREAMERSTKYAHETGEAYARAFVEFSWAIVEMLAGKWQKCLTHALRAREQFVTGCPGSTWEAGTAAAHAISARARTGDWLANVRETPALIEQARNRGDRFTEVSLQLLNGHLTSLIADEPVTAEQDIQRCLAIWPSNRFDFQQLHAFQGLVDIDLYEGNASSAWSRTEKAWPEIQRSGMLRVTLLETFAYATRARAALARANGEDAGNSRESLLETAAACAQHLHRSRAGYATGLGSMIAAGVAAARGDRHRFRNLLLRAEGEFAAAEMIPWLAAVRLSLAPLLEGDAAAERAASANSWMESQRIRRPGHLVRMFLPLPNASGPGA